MMQEAKILGVLALVAAAFAARADDSPAAAASLPSAEAPVHETKIGFADLSAGPIALQGVQSSARLNIGTRRDEAVVGATLHLRFTYSPSMMPELSHLRISVNGEALAALALSKADAGREIEREVILDPRYFSDFNEIRFDLIGHYTLQCEDPQHSSLWATISPLSDLTLATRAIELRNDLASLPEPFFDRRDNRPVVLPMLFAAGAPRDVLRSAGIAASWFGVLADYRGARFPVRFDALPSQHALVFATNASRPKPLDLPAVDEPTVRVIDNPLDHRMKLLVFQGKDEAQLRTAVEGLVLGNDVLTGLSATVGEVRHARRPAYDAPRWLRTDRAVKFGELVDSNAQLQASSISPAPISLNLRLPPDLFTWNRSGVPIDLHYRYSAPIERDDSRLTVSINNQLLRSYPLTPDSQSGGDGRFVVPLLESDASRQSRGLVIPAFELASTNQMQFSFALVYHRDGLCQQVSSDSAREAIDPDSTIDLSSFPHYAALPNLALFADAGYPFTRFADLGETAVVLPDSNDPVALEQLFFVLGRFGRQTGAVALSYALLDVPQAHEARGLDLLILSGSKANDLVAGWDQNLALVFDTQQRTYHDTARAAAIADFSERPDMRSNVPSAGVKIHAAGSLGAIMSFESPLTAGRTVVALLGTDDRAAESLIEVLGDDGKVPFVRGDLTVVRGSQVQSHQGPHSYFVGRLAWWQWMWFHFSRHALLLTLASLATAILAALLIYGWLQRTAARRLDPRDAAH